MYARSTLTNVPVERQKLLLRGKVLRNDADLKAALSAASSNGGLKLALMGTALDGAAAASVQKTPEKTLFVEDLTPAQQAALLRERNVEPLPNVRPWQLQLERSAVSRVWTQRLLLVSCLLSGLRRE